MKSVAPSILARSTPTLPSSSPGMSHEPSGLMLRSPVDDAQTESYRAQLTRDARGVGPERRLMREDIAGPWGASSRPMWETLEGTVREKAQEFIQQIMEEEVTELLATVCELKL